MKQQTKNLKNIQAAHAAQFQKNKQPNQKMSQRTKKTFLQRRHTDGNKYTKRCSTSLIVRKMKIKTTMRYHLMPIRMAAVKKSTNSKCLLERVWRKGNPLTLLVGMQTSTATVENSVMIP